MLVKCWCSTHLTQSCQKGAWNYQPQKSQERLVNHSDRNTTFSTKNMTGKVIKAKSSVPTTVNTYPEIEKSFPFNPLDFEFCPAWRAPDSTLFLEWSAADDPLWWEGTWKAVTPAPTSPLKMCPPPWESNLLQRPPPKFSIDPGCWIATCLLWLRY